MKVKSLFVSTIFLTSLIALPQVQAPVHPTQEQLLLDIISSKLPLFSNDDNNLSVLYEKFVTSLSITTDQNTLDKGLDAFVSNVMTTVLVQTTLSVTNLEQASMIVGRVISSLATLNNKLAGISNSEPKRTIISKNLVTIRTKLTDLTKKIQKQKLFQSTLEVMKRITDDQLQKKVEQGNVVLQQIDQEILDELKGDFISVLEQLVTYAKSKTDKELAIITPLITKAQQATTFTNDQKVKLTGLFQVAPKIEVKPVTLTQAAEIPKADVSASFQNKFKEVTARQSIVEKNLGFKELLTFLTPATLQADKNSIVTLCNDLFLQFGTFKKSELNALREILSNALQNQFLLSVNQRPVMEQWIKTIDSALEFANDTDSLVINIKNIMNQDGQNFMGALKATLFALSVLETKLPLDELDKRKDNSLITLIRKKFQTFYNARAYKKTEELAMLKNIFEVALGKKDVADAVGKDWVDTLALNMKLLTAQQEKNILSQLQILSGIIPTLKSSTDRYEKGIFVDMLATHFANRSYRAAREIEVLKTLFSSLTTSEIKNNRVFDATTIDQYSMWRKILEATYTLLIAQIRGVDQKITLLKPQLLTIALANADYERTLFMPVLNDIFLARGDMQVLQLTAARDLFMAVQKTPGLLSTEQVNIIQSYVNAFHEALGITQGTTTYLEAMVALATKAKDISLATKALGLCTQQTLQETRNKFVILLNTLFAQRSTLDATALLKLFEAVSEKKIGNNDLLSSEQMKILKQWQSVL